MQMDVGLDTGDMLPTVREPIHADDSTGSLHDRLAAQGAQAGGGAGPAGRAEPAAAAGRGGDPTPKKIGKAEAQLIGRCRQRCTAKSAPSTLPRRQHRPGRGAENLASPAGRRRWRAG